MLHRKWRWKAGEEVSVIFDGLMAIMHGEIVPASPEGSTVMIDGDEVSMTFDRDHAAVHREDVSAAQPASEIVDGKAVAGAESE